VVAYEMLTGEKPFTGGAAQVMFAHLQQPAPDARDVNDEISRNAAKAILKALEKKPEDRFESAGSFVRAMSP
jgi:serine/threonine protein kinase